MTSYCKRCMIPCEESVCPLCGEDRLEEILPEDTCFVTEQQMLWAGVLEDVLKQKRVPHMKKPVYGAGLCKSIGSYVERYRFYVPYEYLSTARDVAEELFSGMETEEEL